MATQEPGKAILSGLNIVHSYGGQPVLDNVNLTLHEGDRLGLIGRNGSGKSTLLRLLSGDATPDAGSVVRAKGVRVALLTQQCTLPADATVGELLEEAAREVRELLASAQAAHEALAASEPGAPAYKALQEEAEELQHALEIAEAWTIDQEISRISQSLALPDATRRAGELSGGELRRVDLARKLIQRPDVLLLDEPTNHIDTRSVRWIEQFLSHYRGSCVLVTHDRYFLDRVVNRIVEISFNRLYSFPGNYARFLEYKMVVEDTEARAEDRRRAMIRRELVWYRRGAQARSTKQKARIQRLETAQEQGGPPQEREFDFAVPEPQPLGKTVLEAHKVGHGFDDAWLFRNFDIIMQAGMRVGIVGPNGSGKTTLLRVLMGREQPRKGRIVIGENTAFLYVDQSHEEIRPDESILDYVAEGAQRWQVGKTNIYVPSYLEKFLFDTDALYMPMRNLSGGERNRLNLAKKLLRGGNFLVLDEPTNDLDLYTLRVLEEAIEHFGGCSLIVSHDRYFLNRLCTHMLVFESDSDQIVQITGNYDDYLLYAERRDAERKEQAASAAEKAKPKAAEEGPKRPRRLSYKEKEELARMEERILAAEEAVEAREAAIQDPAFFEKPHEEVQESLQALEQAKAAVEQLYARWEALEGIRRDG